MKREPRARRSPRCSTRAIEGDAQGDVRLRRGHRADRSRTRTTSRRRSRSLEFLVVQDIFLNETAKLAHVVLPGSAFLEKTGTFTNAERRIQLVREAGRPPGEARRDLDILFELLGAPRLRDAASRRGRRRHGRDRRARRRTRAASRYERLGRSGLQWPVRARRSTRARRSSIEPSRVRARPSGQRAPLRRRLGSRRARRPSDEFPFILVTGRQLAHYNSGTHDAPHGQPRAPSGRLVEIHPDDAARLAASPTATSSRSRRARGAVQT